MILGHGNPRLRVILENGIEANLKLLPLRYSIQHIRIKENTKRRAGKGKPLTPETSGQAIDTVFGGMHCRAVSNTSAKT